MQSEISRRLHVAIIMDGNGRWASRRGMPRVAGHRAGVVAVRRTVEHAPSLGIERLTLYAFSSDNWRRPAYEVQSIFHLLRAYLRLESERLKRNGVRLEVIGRRDRLPGRVLQDIERAECTTSAGTRLHLRVAIDYSSRNAITRAAVRACASLVGNQPPSDESMGRALADTLTADSSDVDLLIRTGGEKRLSDFLLWESAYAELHFTERMWPDFDTADLETALRDFKHRERRFGGLPATAPQFPALPLGGVQ
jgi:undecaprenyl diphosphate synthase